MTNQDAQRRFLEVAAKIQRGVAAASLRAVEDPAVAVPGFMALEVDAQVPVRGWVRGDTVVMARSQNFGPALDALRLADEVKAGARLDWATRRVGGQDVDDGGDEAAGAARRTRAGIAQAAWHRDRVGELYLAALAVVEVGHQVDALVEEGGAKALQGVAAGAELQLQGVAAHGEPGGQLGLVHEHRRPRVAPGQRDHAVAGGRLSRDGGAPSLAVVERLAQLVGAPDDVE